MRQRHEVSEGPIRLVFIDDDAALCETVERGFTRRGFEVHVFTSPSEALARIGTLDLDVVVTDLNMREFGGIEVCHRVHAIQPGLPVVVVTAFGSLDTAVGAIRAGAYDFVTKPFDLDATVLAIERAAQHRRLTAEVTRLREVVAGNDHGELLGASPAMQRVYDLLDRIATTDSTVLVSGESGTGKELVARALHNRSKRSKGPFVAINCAALPESLLESELFGHAKGAFTDAKAARTGLVVRAHGGTLFLDEIGEMPPGMQAKLLRVLQERTVRPVGELEELRFDARIITATNRDLASMVEAGRFREDLYFRLNVIELDLPPLRARGNDVLLLAQHMLERASRTAGRPVIGIAPDAAKKLVSYAWPGNVRELQNCMERAVALTRFDQITSDDLPQRITDYRPSNHVLVTSDDPSELVTMEEVERRYILRVLDAVKGHRGQAAKVLGLDRKTLYRKLDAWGNQQGQDT